jgi:DNA-binding MarR family transcriptional regulator
MELTATGHTSLADCNEAVVRIENRMLADLDRDERATLRDLLSRCLGSVHDDPPATG